MELTNLSGQRLQPDKLNHTYVLLDKDLNILIDPTTQQPWFTESERYAKDFARDTEKTFKKRFYHVTLMEAIQRIAKQKYNLNIKRTSDVSKLENNIIEEILRKPFRFEN